MPYAKNRTSVTVATTTDPQKNRVLVQTKDQEQTSTAEGGTTEIHASDKVWLDKYQILS
jgi:hypothetical protein